MKKLKMQSNFNIGKIFKLCHTVISPRILMINEEIFFSAVSQRVQKSVDITIWIRP